MSGDTKRTPLRAVRAKCLDCAVTATQVTRCGCDDCALYHLRSGHGSRAVLRPIRHYCLWCGGGSSNEVKLCPVEDCPLYEYRNGHRPRADVAFAVTAKGEGGHSGASYREREGGQP